MSGGQLDRCTRSVVGHCGIDDHVIFGPQFEVVAATQVIAVDTVILRQLRQRLQKHPLRHYHPQAHL